MIKSIIFIFFIIAFSQVSMAQWEKTAWQSSARITDLYVNGDTVLLNQAYDRLIISENNCEKWKFFNEFSNNLPTNDIAILDSNILLGGYGFFYTSSDFGKNWKKSHPGLPSHIWVNSIEVVDKKVYLCTASGIYTYSDETFSWEIKDKGLEKINRTYACAIHDDSMISIVSIDKQKKTYFSSDMGENWEQRSNGLDDSGYDRITVDNNGVFYLGTQNDPIAGGNNFLSISTNNGQNWIKRSVDIIKDANDYEIIAIGNRIFISVASSLHYSTDLGGTWTNITSLLPKKMQRGINMLYKKGNDLYAVSGSDIFLSNDFGNSWKSFRTTINYGFATSMVENNGNLIVGSSNYWTMTSFEDAVYFSSDNGETWVRKGLKNKIIHKIYQDKDKIFAIGSFGNYISSDFGDSWGGFHTEFSDTSSNMVLAFNSSTIFSGYKNLGIYSSTDNGKTWIEKNNGLPFPNIFLKSLEATNEYVFAGFGEAFYFSSNNGESWHDRTSNLPVTYLDISQIKYHNNKLYVLTDVGLFFSGNLGENWSSINGGLSENDFKDDCLMFLYDSSIILYLKTLSSGIYISNDNGENWVEKSEGITTRGLNVSSFTVIEDYIFSSTDIELFGSEGSGIFRAKISDIITGIDEELPQVENRILIYPNPVEDYLEIDLNYEFDKIEIYSSLGIRVLETNFQKRINVSCLAKGAYFVKIGSEFEKFIKL